MATTLVSPSAKQAGPRPFGFNPNPRSKAEHYWNQVHEIGNQILAQFPGKETVWVTSIEDPLRNITGGRVFETDVRQAAMRIVERTHRLSTEEEIVAELARDKAESARLKELEEQRKQQSILKPSEEQMAAQANLVGTVVKAVLQELRGGEKGEKKKE